MDEGHATRCQGRAIASTAAALRVKWRLSTGLAQHVPLVFMDPIVRIVVRALTGQPAIRVPRELGTASARVQATLVQRATSLVKAAWRRHAPTTEPVAPSLGSVRVS